MPMAFETFESTGQSPTIVPSLFFFFLFFEAAYNLQCGSGPSPLIKWHTALFPYMVYQGRIQRGPPPPIMDGYTPIMRELLNYVVPVHNLALHDFSLINNS